MNAEYCKDWWVTFYADNGDDIPFLLRIVNLARQRKIPFGSVGVVAQQSQKWDEKVHVYVSLLHFSKAEAQDLLASLGFGFVIPFVPVGNES